MCQQYPAELMRSEAAQKIPKQKVAGDSAPNL
jgi:hypothetical protein